MPQLQRHPNPYYKNGLTVSSLIYIIQTIFFEILIGKIRPTTQFTLGDPRTGFWGFTFFGLPAQTMMDNNLIKRIIDSSI